MTQRSCCDADARGRVRCHSAAPSMICRFAHDDASPLPTYWRSGSRPPASDAGHGTCAHRLPNRRRRSPQLPSGPRRRRTRPRPRGNCFHQADAVRIDFRAGGEVAQRIARIRHLIETDDSPVLAFALAASSEIDAHRHIAPLGKLLGHNALPVPVFIATEAVQHDEAVCAHRSGDRPECARYRIILGHPTKAELRFHNASLHFIWRQIPQRRKSYSQLDALPKQRFGNV